MKKILKSALILTLSFVTAACLFSFASSAQSGKWITTWSTAPTEINLRDYDETMKYLGSVNTRTVVTPTASGEKLRVKFSNYYGTEPLVITNATVAYSKGDSKIDRSSLVTLTFDGEKGVTIKPGQELYSDEIDFVVTAMEDITVSLFFKQLNEIKNLGFSGAKTYITYDNSKDSTSIESFNTFDLLDVDDTLKLFLNGFMSVFLPDGVLNPSLSFDIMDIVPGIAGIEVFNSNPGSYTVAVLGDSTVANDFPEQLAQYVISKGVENVGIAGKGVLGNRVLGENVSYNTLIKSESLIDRISRDVLGIDGKNQSNVRYVILKAGGNDIIDAVCADVIANNPGITQPTYLDIVKGFKKIFQFCHDNNLKVVVVGITPWKGATMDYFATDTKNYDRTAEEYKADWTIALKVNKWLAKTDLHDGYVNFNSLSVSSSDSSALNPAYTSDGFNPTSSLTKIWAKNFKKSLIGIGTTVQSVSLSATKKTIFVGSSATLTATVSPEKASNKKVTWSSSDKSVATVDSNGKVTAVSNGTCNITVTTKESGYTASCKITVKTKPTSIKIKCDSKTIYTTQKMQLTATVLPKTSSFKDVTWKSSDKSIATVSSKGVVKGVGKGTVKITAVSTYDKSIKASITLTVKKKVSVDGVSLDKAIVVKYKGASYTLTPTISPAKATFKDVKWSSSDPSIASVNSKGKVTAKKAGIVTITCTSVDNPLCKATCTFKVKIKTTGVTLSKTKLNMYVTQQKTFKATVLPSDASNKRVTWSSSDNKIATVDSSGRVTAKSVGKVTITAKTENGGYQASCVVTVKKYVPVKKVILNTNTVSIKDGNTYTLTSAVSPANASNQSVKWSSSNKKIATVSSKGVITGQNPGTCTITCTSKDTGKTAKCTVTVKKVSVKSVSFAKSVYKVNYRETIQLSVDILPANASNQKVTWTSSNPSYAKVSSSGKVTGLKEGKTVTITATTVDGKKVATCKVKIMAVAVTGVTLDKKTASVVVGKSIILNPTVFPSNASNKHVTWKSSDTSVATVTEKGIVTAKSAGTVVISCKTDDGGFNAYCILTVKTISVTAVYLDNSSLVANKGTTFYLVPTITPFDATNKNVTWSSTNSSVAKVSSTGKVTAVGLGTCYITVTTKDGNHKAQCKITVI